MQNNFVNFFSFFSKEFEANWTKGFYKTKTYLRNDIIKTSEQQNFSIFETNSHDKWATWKIKKSDLGWARATFDHGILPQNLTKIREGNDKTLWI